jgi:hypothetical protein
MQQCTKTDLVKPIANIYSQGFQGNLFHIFLSFILFSMHFLALNEFPEILNQKKGFLKIENL